MSQSVNDRLDQSAHGTPKLNPDEQRKYLGTFRERVSLAIKIKDMATPHAINSLGREIKQHPNYQLIINGRLDNDLTAPYLRLASSSNVKFTIKTDAFYFTDPEWYGVIYAAKQAINQYPIELNAKYPAKNKAKPTSSEKSQAPKKKQPGKIKKWFKHLF